MIKDFLHFRNVDYISIPFRNTNCFRRKRRLKATTFPNQKASRAMSRKGKAKMDKEKAIEYFDRMVTNARQAASDYGDDELASRLLLESIAYSLSILADNIGRANL